METKESRITAALEKVKGIKSYSFLRKSSRLGFIRKIRQYAGVTMPILNELKHELRKN